MQNHLHGITVVRICEVFSHGASMWLLHLFLPLLLLLLLPCFCGGCTLKYVKVVSFLCENRALYSKFCYAD